jgi:hypothetical protein
MRTSSVVARLFIVGVLQELIIIGLLSLGSLREAIPAFLLLYFIAFLTYLVAVRYSRHGVLDHKPTVSVVTVIVIFALLFRVTLFFSEPSLSEDIYRYLWDGKLLNNGINPYRYPPGALELTYLRDLLYAPINHKDIGTPYGPIAIMIFSLSQRALNSVYLMKVPFIVFDIISMFIILRILDVIGKPRNNVIIYAWHPLVLVEIAGSGHNDSAAIVCLLASLYWILLNRYWAASLAMTAAFLTKYLVTIFLPVVWRNFRKFEWVVFPIGLVVFFAPFHKYLDEHVVSLLTVGSSWRFNDSLFSLVYFATGSLFLSKVFVAAAFFVLVAVVLLRDLPVLKSAMILIGGALLLTTTVQPWYLLWIIPFLVFYPNRAWLLLTALIVLSYHVLILYEAEGIWRESVWIKIGIYAPFYALLIGDWVRKIWIRSTWQRLGARFNSGQDS